MRTPLTRPKIAIFELCDLWLLEHRASSKVVTLSGGICVSRRRTTKCQHHEFGLWQQACTSFMPRDAKHKCGQCRRAVSVCLSVTFVYSVETNKRIFNFSPSGSYTPFQYLRTKRYGNIPTGSTGASTTGGVGKKSRLSANIWLHRMLWTVRPLSGIHTAAPDRGKFVTLVKRRRLFFTGDDDEAKCLWQ